MAIRNIRIEEDPILRKKSKRIEKIDEKIIELIKDMEETMNLAEGIGIAAVQVGILKRLFIIDIGEGLHVFINPEIIEKDGEYSDIEGCLSLPGYEGEVVRPMKVKIRATGIDGEEFELEGEELFARAICHEYDHLEGKLFIDSAINIEKKEVCEK